VIASLILVFSSIIFSLFWIVFHYNLLYVTKSRPNTSDLLYSTTLNQLFIEVYVMELCIIGLFFLVRDDHDRSTCVDQAVIMIIAIAMTVIFQFLLNNAFAPLLRFLPSTEVEIAEEGEEEEEGQKYHTPETNNYLRILVQSLWNWTTISTASQGSITTLFSDLHDSKKDSASNELDGLVPLAFQHEALHIQRPVIWIPKDSLGISDNEVFRIRKYDSNMRISNEHADLDIKGRVTVTQNPREFSEVESKL